jgi:hypothetical protein
VKTNWRVEERDNSVIDAEFDATEAPKLSKSVVLILKNREKYF